MTKKGAKKRAHSVSLKSLLLNNITMFRAGQLKLASPVHNNLLLLGKIMWIIQNWKRSAMLTGILHWKCIFKHASSFAFSTVLYGLFPGFEGGQRTQGGFVFKPFDIRLLSFEISSRSRASCSLFWLLACLATHTPFYILKCRYGWQMGKNDWRKNWSPNKQLLW